MTTTERREREKQQRRQQFIETAEALFLKHGYDGVSIDSIAQGAEFSKRTVYLYFRDKRDLFHAVVHRGLSRLHAILTASLVGVEPGVPSLRALADAYYRFFQGERGHFDLILDYEMHDYHYAAAADAMGEYGRLCQETNDRNSETVARAVAEAVQRTETVVPDLDPQQLTLILWGQVIGILQLIARREEVMESAYGMTAESFFQHAFSVSLRGVFRV